MTIEREFEFRKIAYQTTKGPMPTLAWCRGDFAVHENIVAGYCEIIHLMSGTAFPARFSNRDAAMRATKDIQLLRTDWPVFVPRTMITLELRRALRAIIDRHHGILYASKALSKATAPFYDAGMKAHGRTH